MDTLPDDLVAWNRDLVDEISKVLRTDARFTLASYCLRMAQEEIATAMARGVPQAMPQDPDRPPGEQAAGTAASGP